MRGEESGQRRVVGPDGHVPAYAGDEMGIVNRLRSVDEDEEHKFVVGKQCCRGSNLTSEA